jgi:hypothetical protein
VTRLNRLENQVRQLNEYRMAGLAKRITPALAI